MNQVNYKANCNIDYKAWAAEYKEQEDKLKARIKELKIKNPNTAENRLISAKRLDVLESIYFETKAARLLLEKRVEQTRN